MDPPTKCAIYHHQKEDFFFFFGLADHIKLREERVFAELFVWKFRILCHMDFKDSSVALSPKSVMVGSSRHTAQVGFFLYFIVWAEHLNEILERKRIIYVKNQAAN